MKLLLFSGGVESTCLAFQLRPDFLLTIDYGQKSAKGEIEASSFIADKLKLHHEILNVNISALGVGDLAGRAPIRDGIATEFWPFRNQFLITLAAMYCAPKKVSTLYIGTISTDHLHEDGNPEFISKINNLLRQQAPELEVIAPAIKMNSLELVRASGIPKDLLGWTFSCYRSAVACGQCRGCLKTVELKNQLIAN